MNISLGQWRETGFLHFYNEHWLPFVILRYRLNNSVWPSLSCLRLSPVRPRLTWTVLDAPQGVWSECLNKLLNHPNESIPRLSVKTHFLKTAMVMWLISRQALKRASESLRQQRTISHTPLTFQNEPTLALENKHINKSTNHQPVFSLKAGRHASRDNPAC